MVQVVLQVWGMSCKLAYRMKADSMIQAKAISNEREIDLFPTIEGDEAMWQSSLRQLLIFPSSKYLKLPNRPNRGITSTIHALYMIKLITARADMRRSR
jgi:hypothetical protein